MIKIHFYSKNTLIAKAIKRTTRSKWNHVSIEINGNVYEAIGGRLLGANGILKSCSPFAFHKGTFILETMVYSCFTPKEQKVINQWCNDQVGSNYDTLEALSFKWRWLKGKANLYICSSFVLNAIAQVDKSIDVTAYYSPEDVRRIARLLHNRPL